MVVARPLSFESTPCSVARSEILCNGSMARIKRNSESGSPCLSPCLCQIRIDGTPLTMTMDEEEERIKVIHSHHRGPKPIARMISRMYGQDTESKAFAKSSFSKIEGIRTR